jgi:hypothetical protein
METLPRNPTKVGAVATHRDIPITLPEEQCQISTADSRNSQLLIKSQCIVTHIVGL